MAQNAPVKKLRLPKGLSYGEAARRLGLDYQACRKLLLEQGYRATDGRTYAQNGKRRFPAEDADWTRSNVWLARRYGVSRNLVRMWRDRLGKPKVESRGRPRKKVLRPRA